MADFTFTCDRLGEDAVAALTPDFETLAPSAYADGAYRLRRYSRFTFDRAAGALSRLPGADFVQSEAINQHQGNVVRRYDEVLESTWRSPAFAELVTRFADAAELPEQATLEVHQMRVIAHQEAAEAAPEGVHQDGFDRICIATLGRANSVGADLSVHEQRDAAPLVTLHQEAGQYCVLNDAQLWHSADALRPLESGRPATWDLFVLTANRA